MTRKSGFFFVFLFSLRALSASPWADEAFRLVVTAPPREVQRAIETDYSFGKFTRGNEKENLLMAALKSSRDNDVVDMLMRQAKISPDSKTKSGVTAFMYACQYETNLDVIKNVLNYGAASDKEKARRILARDNEGNTSFDYAKKNELLPADVLNVLGMYALEPQTEEEILPEEEAVAEEPAQETDETGEEAEEPPPEETEPSDSEFSDSGEIGEPEAEEEPPLEEIPAEAEGDAELPPAEVNALLDLAAVASPMIIPESIRLYDYAADTAAAILIPEALVEAEEADRHYVADANKTDSSGRTKLMDAAKRGDIAKIEDLLYSGAQIDAKDSEGWTALMYAARFQKNADVTQLLLLKGADRTLKNKYGLTALLLAAGYTKNPDVISLLLDSCAADSDTAREALAYGIANYNDSESLEAFVDKKVPLNVPYNGKTPLMLACETGRNTKIIEWLLKNGASKQQVEANSGKTAFDYAKENKKLPHNVTYWSLNPNS